MHDFTEGRPAQPKKNFKSSKGIAKVLQKKAPILEFFTPQVLTSLTTLIAMEVVLDIDNIVFISILVARVPAERREKIRKFGILLDIVFSLGSVITAVGMVDQV